MSILKIAIIKEELSVWGFSYVKVDLKHAEAFSEYITIFSSFYG